MEESDIIITLIGTKLAKVGNEFIFKGSAKECDPCKLYKTCMGLNTGGKYRIINIRTGPKHECAVHDTGVVAVEVQEMPVRITVESRKAIQGSTIVYDIANCNNSDCMNYVFCRPEGLRRGDKFTIADVLDDMPEPCEKGFSLKVVEVKRT